jgi:hypothetical protein
MKRLILAVAAVLVLSFTVGVSAAERFVIPLNSENDLTLADKTFNAGGVNVAVSMSRPAAPFVPINFTFAFSQKGTAADVENVSVRFNMKMDMGEFVYSPVLKDGVYTADPVLPKCMMGGELWFGKLEFAHKGARHSKVFFFKIPRQ